MRKTGFLLALALFLSVLLLPVCGQADRGYTWSVEDGVLTITGTGMIGPYDFASSSSPRYSTSPWDSYKDNITKVVIGEGITDIGYMSFSWMPRLNEITLPSTLKRISNQNFDDCSITRINWGGTLNQWMSINYYTYEYSSFIRPTDNPMLSDHPYLYLGDGSNDSGLVKEIHLGPLSPAVHRYHFRNIANQFTLSVGRTYSKTIGEQAFAQCDGLNTIAFDSSGVSIASTAFNGVTATVYYTPDDAWTDKIQNYGGTLSWYPLSDWASIRNRIKGSETDISVILTGDVTADDYQISISYGKKVIFDLAGHTVTCNGAGYFFFVEEGGELIIRDSAGGGKLTGATDTNGAIINKGTLTLQGGSICNSRGVGVSNRKIQGSTTLFTMSGGSITGNKKEGVKNYDFFILNGGTISGNGIAESAADNECGVYNDSDATLEMTGGTISRNGTFGVYLGGWYSYFTMRGGTITGHPNYGVSGKTNSHFIMIGGQITENTQGVDAMSVSVSVGGTATVTGNGTENAPWNMYLGSGNRITLVTGNGGLASEARIGIKLNNCPYTFMTGIPETANAAAENFMPDTVGQFITKQNGEITVEQIPTATTFAELQDLLENGQENTIMVTADLTIPAGDSAVLDLNGKTVTLDAYTLTVAGNLMICDSLSGGAIIGSACETISVNSGAELNILGGTISSTDDQSGVAVSSCGTVLMSGGTVTSAYHGIELYGTASAESIFTLESGNITGSGDSPQYGVWAVSNDRFVMTGGSITGWAYGVMDGNITGSAVEISGGNISGNTNGVVLHRNNALYLSGSPVINNNTTKDVPLSSNMQVIISGTLQNGTVVSVSATSSATFGEGWSQYMADSNPEDYFLSNTPDYQIIAQGTGLLLSPARMVSFAANGGEGSMPVQLVDKGTATVLNLNAFTRRGYHFTEWNTRADGTGTAFIDGAEINTTDNVTLYACWEINIDWTLENGILTISGTGDMLDFEDEEPAPWASFSDNIESVAIENGVTSIGESAFYECENLTTVTMADSVTKVGGCAFLRCPVLASVQLSNGLTEIQYAAFSECPSLTAIVLPGSLKTLGMAAFADCGITSITVSAGVETKTWDFFYPGKDGQDHLYHIALPASVTDAGYGAFCMNPLKCETPDFVMPSGLTTIEEQAFSGTTPRFVWLPEGVETISASAFAGCQTPLYVYVPYGCKSIAQKAFPEGTVILGYGGYDEPTYIEQYAEDNGYTFLDLENPFSGNG